MTRLLTLLATVMIATTPAWADPAPKPPTDGMAYPQILSSVKVDYRRNADGLDMIFIDQRVLTACGRVTDMPTKLTYDIDAADIIVGDYTFVHPIGTQKHDCGPTSKSSSAKVHLSAADLATHNVQSIRVWYKTDLDTFRIYGTGANMTLNGPFGPKNFSLGRDLDKLVR